MVIDAFWKPEWPLMLLYIWPAAANDSKAMTANKLEFSPLFLFYLLPAFFFFFCKESRRYACTAAACVSRCNAHLGKALLGSSGKECSLFLSEKLDE